jgi:hypothetical protein
MESLSRWLLARGMVKKDWVRLLRSYNANAPEFKAESEKHE